MAKLPRQLPWKEFLHALRKLGYELEKAGPGSSRTFKSTTRNPKRVAFHEAHSPRTIPPGTLRAYIRQLDLSLDEFLKLLD
jgi:predicted RNA binding protein YcfA (HicA-like mRNA interferase family)